MRGPGRPKTRKTPLVRITLALEPQLARKWNARKKKEALSGPQLLAKLL